MLEEKSKKVTKSLFGGTSPKLAFFFGLVIGLAVFSLLGMILLGSIIFAPSLRKKTPSTENKQTTEETKKTEEEVPPIKQEQPTVNKFEEKEGKEICKENGKPVIRLFSTTWCPHCVWIKETFDKVAKEYVDKGKIKAYHWEVDTNDNTLTTEKEGKISEEEMAVYQEFNPGGSIPTFVFGCKYWRIGNTYEREKDLAKEEADFREIIDGLLEK